MEDLDEHGVARGLEHHKGKILARAEQLRWPVPYLITENDLVQREGGRTMSASAFTRKRIVLPNGREVWRTFRPGFRDLLHRLATRVNDGLICLDLDRMFRQPRDLEDLIDVFETCLFPVESATGSLRLYPETRDTDVTTARILVTMANKSSRDTSRRVASMRQWMAHNHVWGGGLRPFGFESDGVTRRPEEAILLQEAARRFLQGEKLKSIAREMREAGVLTTQGNPMNGEALVDILARERNAGRMVYKGEVVGTAPWAPIVTPAVQDAITRKLAEPGRRAHCRGPAPKWIGSGLYQCTRCPDGPIRCKYSKQGERQYKCMTGHLTRLAQPIDDWVEYLIVQRLSQDDAADLFVPKMPEVSTPELRELELERSAIMTNLETLAGELSLGLATRDQFQFGTRLGRSRIEEIDAVLRAVAVPSPLTAVINAESVAKSWGTTPLGTKRLILDTVMTVRILPVKPGRRLFRTDSVEIEFKA